MGMIDRQAAIDTLRAMQTYKLFAGDDMLLIDQAGAQTELMLLPSAQPYTIHSDGRLWVTVDDIDKVNAVVVDEKKSKFCKQFYMDAQPEIVHCKDCQYSEYDAMYGDRYCHYDGKAEVIPDGHFCGYGKERQDG